MFIVERIWGEMVEFWTENECEDSEGHEISLMNTNMCAYADPSIDQSGVVAGGTRRSHEQEDF